MIMETGKPKSAVWTKRQRLMKVPVLVQRLAGWRPRRPDSADQVQKQSDAGELPLA